MSWALSRDRIHFPVFYEVELSGMAWLVDNRDRDTAIYYDDSAEMGFVYFTPWEEAYYGIYGLGQRFIVYQETPEEFGSIPVIAPENLEPGSYIYLREINNRKQELAILVVEHKLLTIPRIMPLKEMPVFMEAINQANVIFDNGGSEVRIMQ